MKFIFFFTALLVSCLRAYAWAGEPDPEKIARALAERGPGRVQAQYSVDSTMQKLDSARVFDFLEKLEDEGPQGDVYFQTGFNCLKARQLVYRKVYLIKNPELGEIRKEVMQLISEAMEMAYRSEDDALVAYVSTEYAHIISTFKETGLTIMYGMKGINLYEKLNYPILPQDYQFMAEMLYRVREYAMSIRYGIKAVEAWRKSENIDQGFVVSALNTIALSYHRQNVYDSAFYYYDQALTLAQQTKNKVWTGIVSGNMGQIFYAQHLYDTAYALLKMDYQVSKEEEYYDNAANSLQWAARASLKLGNKNQALGELREAFQLLQLWPDANYLRNTCYTAIQVFRELGNYDSAFHYNNLYAVLNDSLERVVSTSSLAISQAKLNDEASRYKIEMINRENREQLVLRNFIIAGIVLLSVFAVVMINRKRLRTKFKMEKAEQEKLMMEREVSTAQELLKMFTANIVDKTALIEKLEQQARNRENSAQQEQLIEELGKQTILTEEDWIRFKSLFEKIHPGFFLKLKERAPDITVAEQRMAALVRLQLTVRQMASMLGISTDSVHKSRQRLRQRLQLEADTTLEDKMAVI